MLKSKITFVNDRPFIEIDSNLHLPLAYTTYFDECGEWSDFIKSGYKIFFVNISFTDLPINNNSGFTPFITGVFEGDIPDYSEFDKMVKNIISECPDALIFPRINIAMPRKWLRGNPYETVITESGPRESLYSDLFMRDGSELLKALVSHIRSSDYAHRIAGYQLCGGTTQEWMHHDLCGSYSETGMKKFRQWCFEKHGIKDIKAPSREDLKNGILTEEIKKYYEFCNEMPAKTIEHFAKALKDFINNEQIVGVFYGYSAYVNMHLWGLHGLSNLINSPYIDFFSSPCCYDNNRELGVDWGDMLPADSVKLHKKLYFVECDIRTHLTRRMQDSRPGKYPEDKYLLYDENGNKTVWCGPDTKELSISALRKAFAHQITNGSGIWWFDMWGGWYHDKEIMNELSEMKLLYDSLKTKSSKDLPSAEVVLFIDEKAYANIPQGNHLLNTVNHYRISMSHSGIPFDMCLVEDAESVINRYKFAIFTAPRPTENGKKAMELFKKHSIPFFASTEEMPYYDTEELRKALVDSGIHCYNSDGSVLYYGNGFIGIHTISDEETKITLPKKHKIRSLFDNYDNEFEADEIIINAPKHTTKIFEILK